DQWHTMTRSGTSPRLAGHSPEPFVAVHPADADIAGLADGGFAKVRTAPGARVLKGMLDAGQRPGSLFAPIHLSDPTAARARIGELVTSANDPVSGQPELKATPAAITPVTFGFRGFTLARERIALPRNTWWARVALADGMGWLFASNDTPATWRTN